MVDMLDVYSRNGGIKAFYEAGYITKEEAEELLYKDHTQRNVCTRVFIYEHYKYIALICCEYANKSKTMLFYLKYDRITGLITEETNKTKYM